jgi:hypothetical protein
MCRGYEKRSRALSVVTALDRMNSCFPDEWSRTNHKLGGMELNGVTGWLR